MIRLITLNNPRMAQAFIDYMVSRRIEIELMPESGGQFSLWLIRDEDRMEAETELHYFLHHPNDKKYAAASWAVAESRPLAFRYSSPSLFGMLREKAGYFTLSIMLLCVIIFFMRMFGMQQTILDALLFPSSSAQAWELWRWVSHALLHFSVIHIVFNLLWWWFFGGDIEKRLGSFKLVGLFVISAAGSGLVQFWVEGANFGGLSGVVYALAGFLWMLGWKAPERGLTIQKPILGFMLVWLVLGFVQPFMPIANSAHLTGLLIGMLLGLNEARRT